MIASVGCEVPGGSAECLPLDSRASLLEWDIILFNPDIQTYMTWADSYQGKPALSESRSASLSESTLHWQRELADATKAGKTVFFLLSELQEVYVDTGERQYSGTGRNRQTTRIVGPYNNYRLLPFGVRVTASVGKAMVLTAAGAVLGDYWRRFAEHSVYQVVLSGNVGTPLVVTKSGDRVVGALHTVPNSAGSLVLLPYIDLEDDRFTRQVTKRKSKAAADDTDDLEDPEYVWTSEGKKFGAQLVEALIAVDHALHEGGATAPPAWTMNPLYILAAEAKLNRELLVLQKRIEELSKEGEDKKRQIADEGMLRHLLFENGPRLEGAIIKGLTLLGFKASRYRDSESEFDVVFEAPEGRVIGEAEGKDNKPINVDKMRQLEMNLHEDFERKEVSEMAKGALFGNAYRLLPVAERPQFFTDKCMSAAKRAGCALVRTPDLFLVARHIADSGDAEFARRCREALMGTSGRSSHSPNRQTIPCRGRAPMPPLYDPPWSPQTRAAPRGKDLQTAGPSEGRSGCLVRRAQGFAIGARLTSGSSGRPWPRPLRRRPSPPPLSRQPLGCAVKGGAFLQVRVLPRQLAVQPRSYGWTAFG